MYQHHDSGFVNSYAFPTFEINSFTLDHRMSGGLHSMSGGLHSMNGGLHSMRGGQLTYTKLKKPTNGSV